MILCLDVLKLPGNFFPCDFCLQQAKLVLIFDQYMCEVIFYGLKLKLAKK